MKNEKAIEILNALAWVQGGPDREETITAISMAIEALSVEAKGDLISRQWLLDLYETPKDGDDVEWKVSLEVVRQNILDAPSADAVSFEDAMQIRNTILVKEYLRGRRDAKAVQGEWINREYCQVDEDAYEVATCSNCKSEITIEYPYDNYCPNCGAKMKGGENK